jgi:hypothetical protein
MTAYEELQGQLSQLLQRTGHPSRVAWVFQDDLAWVRGTLYVRLPLPTSNEASVLEALKSRKVQDHGVEAHVLATLEAMTLCGLIIPRNSQEAESLMIGGIKCSVLERTLRARPSSGLKWRLLKRLHREPSPIDFLASRAAVPDSPSDLPGERRTT